MKYINIPIFIVSFIIALIYTMIKEKDTNIIYLYPSADSIVMKDSANKCFTWKEKIVSCSSDAKSIPIV